MMSIISRDELKQLIDNREKYTLIDVRNKDELLHGMIPTAKNIPLPELEEAFSLSSDVFEQRYHFKKPSPADTIIFHCRSGGRSQQATLFANSKGYTARNFAGSIWQWAEIDPRVKRYGPEP